MKKFEDFDITADNLSKLSISELEELYNSMPELTEEQKTEAMKVMNTSIYDKDGNLIGDKREKEDTYEE